jgi:hypothetical protein
MHTDLSIHKSVGQSPGSAGETQKPLQFRENAQVMPFAAFAVAVAVPLKLLRKAQVGGSRPQNPPALPQDIEWLRLYPVSEPFVPRGRGALRTSSLNTFKLWKTYRTGPQFEYVSTTR